MTPSKRERFTPDWQIRAACKDADPKIFSPYLTAQKRIGPGRALIFCNDCPVRYDCAWAGLNGNDDVTMGGLTHFERERIKAKTPARMYATVELTKVLLTEVAPQCQSCGKHQRSVKDDGLCYPCRATEDRLAAARRHALEKAKKEAEKANAENRRTAGEDE